MHDHEEEEVEDNRVAISNNESMYNSEKNSYNKCNSSNDNNLEEYDSITNDEVPPDDANDNKVDGDAGSRISYEISRNLGQY